MKYGKLPAEYPLGYERFGIEHVLKASLPSAPSRFGFGLMFTDWGMLGNDFCGDCAWAGPAHETMIATHIGLGTAAQFTAKCVVADYSRFCGYVRGDDSTDVGTSVVDLMNVRRTIGVQDASSKRHKIELAVRLPRHDWSTFIRSVYTFGFVALGFEVPEGADEDFEAGRIWDYHRGRRILGGHYVPAAGSLDSTGEVSVITWGRRQRMTRAFWDAYVDELWVPLSPELVRAGFGLHNIAWSKVEELAKTL